MPFQEKAINYFIDNEERVLNAICEGVIRHSSTIRERYKALPDFPELNTIDDVKRNIVVETIHVLGEEKEGVGYLGFNCDCTWDDEHGMGILMHKDRCVDAGEVEIASEGVYSMRKDKMSAEEWAAYQQERELQIAGNIAAQQQWAEQNQQPESEVIAPPKKWWEFWK